MCLLLVVVWIRSHSVATSIARNHRDSIGGVLHTQTLQSERGRLYLISETSNPDGPTPAKYSTQDVSLSAPHLSWDLTFSVYETGAIFDGTPPPPVVHRRALGLEIWQIGTAGVANSYDAVIVPWWMPTLAACILPGIWVLRRWRGARRSKLGLCRSCGYDLRATPDRCPECGERK